MAQLRSKPSSKAKKRHRVNLLERLSDPELYFPKRCEYPDVIGVCRKTLYRNFSPDELSEIENEAVENRKASSSRQRLNVMDALYKRAIGYEQDILVDAVGPGGELIKKKERIKHLPDKPSAQEFLDRTEGKVIDKKEISGPGGKELRPILNVELTKT
jgi:hypothetical protein